MPENCKLSLPPTGLRPDVEYCTYTPPATYKAKTMDKDISEVEPSSDTDEPNSKEKMKEVVLPRGLSLRESFERMSQMGKIIVTTQRKSTP